MLPNINEDGSKNDWLNSGLLSLWYHQMTDQAVTFCHCDVTKWLTKLWYHQMTDPAVAFCQWCHQMAVQIVISPNNWLNTGLSLWCHQMTDQTVVCCHCDVTKWLTKQWLVVIVMSPNDWPNSGLLALWCHQMTYQTVSSGLSLWCHQMTDQTVGCCHCDVTKWLIEQWLVDIVMSPNDWPNSEKWVVVIVMSPNDWPNNGLLSLWYHQITDWSLACIYDVTKWLTKQWFVVIVISPNNWQITALYLCHQMTD